MFDFRRATVFCLGYFLSKHTINRYAKHLGECPPGLPWLYACVYDWTLRSLTMAQKTVNEHREQIKRSNGLNALSHLHPWWQTYGVPVFFSFSLLPPTSAENLAWKKMPSSSKLAKQPMTRYKVLFVAGTYCSILLFVMFGSWQSLEAQTFKCKSSGSKPVSQAASGVLPFV